MDEPDTMSRALDDLRGGRAVLVLDDAEREGEGDLVFAAQHASAELVAFTVRHTSGFLCVAMADADADRLGLPPMTHLNQDRHGTAYCVTVDAREGGSTGISASDRAHTLRLLADPATGADDLSRPGHVVPLRARAGGVLARRGHTEAAVDLTILAGLRGVGALCEVVSQLDPTRMARGDELLDFAATHGLTVVTVADVVAYRRRTERLVTRAATAAIPTSHGQFTAVAYRSGLDGIEHLALVAGDLGDGRDVLVRIHSECLTGDVVGSLRCDCGKQFEAALYAVSAAGRGVVVYVRGHEGRGIGLAQKLRAYQLQEAGADTVDANLALGEPADARDYVVAAHMLADLGVSSVRLLSNNPDKRTALEQGGIVVSGTVAIPTFTNPHNLRYLRTKRDRMGHDLPRIEPYRDFGALWAEPAEPAHVANLVTTVRTA